MQGLKFNGLTDYLQLPSMTMDAIEIDLVINSVQPQSNPFILDARNGLANSYFSKVAGLGAGWTTIDGGLSRDFNLIPKDSRLTIKVGASAPFTDNVNIFGAYDNSFQWVTKGTLYSIKCYLAGVVVASYDFVNREDAVDISGNGRHATVIGALPVIKRMRQGLKFDSRTNSQVKSVTPINGVTKTSDYTLKLAITTGNDVTLSQEIFNNTVSPSDRVGMYLINGSCSIGHYDGTSYAPTIKTFTVVPNTYYEIEYSYSSAARVTTMKVNGVDQASSAGSVATSTATGFAFGSTTADTNFGNFIMHYFKIGNSVYLCNEGTGTTLTDTSGNGNHGTIVGATWAIKGMAAMKPSKNIAKQLVSSGYYYDGGGLPSPADSRFIKVDPVDCKPNTTYTLSSNLTIYKFWFFNGDIAISNVGAVTPSYTFTTPAGCTKLRITLNNTSGIADTSAFQWVQVEEGSIATAYEPYQLVPDNRALVKPKKNMLYPAKWVAGRIFDGGFIPASWSYDPATYGVTINTIPPTTATGMVSQRVPVKPNTNYVVNNNASVNTAQGYIYTLSGTQVVLSNTYPFTFNSGANTELILSFYKATAHTSGTATATYPQMEEGSSATYFEPYQLVPDNKAMVKPKKNMFDGYLESGTINSSGVDTVDSTSIRSKNYTPVQPNSTLIMSNDPSSFRYYFYDANKVFISLINGALVTVPSNAYFMRFRAVTADLSVKIQVEQGTVATEYEPYILVPDNKPVTARSL